MNELTTEKTMTVKELADYYDVNEITIRRGIKEVLPNIIKNGVRTELNKEQVSILMQYLMVGRQPDSRGVEVDNRVDRLEKIVESLVEITKTQMQQTQQLMTAIILRHSVKMVQIEREDKQTLFNRGV